MRIFVNVVSDVKDDVVTGARRDRYFVLPFVSFAFGVISYTLFQIGLLQLGASSSTGTGSAGVNSTYLLFIIAFPSAYSTGWFMGKLADLTKGGSSKVPTTEAPPVSRHPPFRNDEAATCTPGTILPVSAIAS